MILSNPLIAMLNLITVLVFGIAMQIVIQYSANSTFVAGLSIHEQLIAL